MADNVTLSTGEIVRTLEDGSSVHHPVSIQVFATSVGSPDVISIPTAAALADDTSNPTTVLYGTCLLAYDGSTWDRVRGDSTDGLLVNLGSNNDVAVTSIVPGTAATNLGKAEDAAHSSGDVGVMALAVRQDSQADFGADGDYVPLSIDADGQLRVTGSGTQYAVDDALGGTPTGTLALAIRDDSLGALTPVEGDAVGLRVNGTGALWVNIEGAAGAITVDGSGFTQPVSGTVAATQSGAWNITNISGTVSLPTGAATAAKQPALGTAGTASADVITVQGIASMTALKVDGSAVTQPVSGTFWQATQPVSLTSTTITGTVAVTQSGTWDEVGINDSGNSITVDAPVGTPVFVRLSDGASAISTLPVSLASVPSHAVTNAGTFAVQVDGAALTALQLIDDAIFAEDVASQAADKGIQILTVRKDTAAATSGTDGDYQPPVSNARGATWVAIEDGAGGQITSFGGGTEYTEDAAAAANPVGKAMILVRADALAGVTTTDGDNVAARGTDKGEVYVKHADSIAVTSSTLATEAKQDTIIGHVDGIEGLLTTIDADTGNISTKIDTIAGAVSGTEMQVDVLTMPTITVNAHAVTNAGTFPVQVDGAALTSLQLIDDAAVVLGTATYTEATSTGLAIGAVRRDADTTLVNTTNEWGPLQMDANGRLKVEAFSGEALPVTFTGSTDVATQTTLASALTALQLIDNPVVVDDAAFTPAATSVMMAGFTFDDVSPDSVNEGDGGAARMSSRREVYVQIRDAAGNERGLNIDGSGKINVDSVTSLTTVGTVTTVTTVSALTGGGVAHDGVDSGAPVKIGLKAIAHGTNPTAVAAADRTDLYANRAGIPFVIGGHPNIITRTATVADADGAQTNVSLLSVSAGTKIVVTRVSITADGSNTGPVNMKVGFGTATLAAASTTGTAGILADFNGVPPGGGMTIGDGSGIIGVGADDEDVRYTCEDPAGGAITVSISYFTIES